MRLPHISAVPIPKRMRALQKDKRGYPIPFIIQRDSDNSPLFTVNDSIKVWRCIEELRCAVCGTKLDKPFWFVGGPLSAFDPYGSYFDSGMHYDCMAYSMQVCPYLALPNYQKMIGLGIVDLNNLPDEVTGLRDNTELPGRPHVLVAVGTRGQTVLTYPDRAWRIKPHRPYEGVEYWLYGKRITPEEAQPLIETDIKWREEQERAQKEAQKEARTEEGRSA